MVKPKVIILEGQDDASISDVIQEITRTFEQFFDVQVVEDQTMNVKEEGAAAGEIENLVTDID